MLTLMGNLSIVGVISFTLFEVFFLLQLFLANVQVLNFLLCNIVSLSVSVSLFPSPAWPQGLKFTQLPRALLQ